MIQNTLQKNMVIHKNKEKNSSNSSPIFSEPVFRNNTFFLEQKVES